MAHALRSLTLTLAMVLIFPAATGWAQPRPPEPPVVNFTVFSTRVATGLGFSPGVGEAAASLQLYPATRSPRAVYRGAMPLQIVEVLTGQVVAEATVPPEITEALLILVPRDPTPGSGLRYQVFVLDDGLARQPAGTLAIVNLSGLSLSGIFGRVPVTLAAGLNPNWRVERSAHLTLRAPFKGRNYQAFSGEIEVSGGERALLLLLPPFYAGSLEVQSRLLSDRPAPPVMRDRP